GLAPNGEVEDYQLSVIAPPVALEAPQESQTLGNGQTSPRQNFGRLPLLRSLVQETRFENDLASEGTIDTLSDPMDQFDVNRSSITVQAMSQVLPSDYYSPILEREEFTTAIGNELVITPSHRGRSKRPMP
ncbi:MAG: hypothetical protein KDA86_26685, partial [Planctomycetaceae bacterium]|nr:hypothetical protein [Planctomycetaceae bacterium]